MIKKKIIIKLYSYFSIFLLIQIEDSILILSEKKYGVKNQEREQEIEYKVKG